MRPFIPDFLKIDEKKAIEKIARFIRIHIKNSGASGVIFGLSGGVDSSVVAELAVNAVGLDKVLALILPEKESNSVDIRDAEKIAERLKLNYIKLDITNIVRGVLSLSNDDYTSTPRIAKGNVKARVRMVTLYYFANRLNRLVLGTGDKSELTLGYFTKYGDGGVDLLPLGGLFKTQVRLIADYLKIPEEIAWKPSSPGLWPGHKALDELGADYLVIDQILYFHERKLGMDEIAEKVNVSQNLVKSIFKRIAENKHKREPPPICRMD